MVKRKFAIYSFVGIILSLNINLNANLLHLPSELVDYVLLHELVHTRVKNHGPDFWNELDTVVPNAKQVDQRLKNYQYCLL